MAADRTSYACHFVLATIDQQEATEMGSTRTNTNSRVTKINHLNTISADVGDVIDWRREFFIALKHTHLLSESFALVFQYNANAGSVAPHEPCAVPFQPFKPIADTCTVDRDRYDSVGIIGDVECESGEETYPVGGTISLDTQLRAAYISCVLSTVNSTKSKKVPEIEIRGRQPILTLLMLT